MPLRVRPIFFPENHEGLERLSNSSRARPLRNRPHKRLTMIMVGPFMTDSTIKIEHFKRGAHLNGGNTCFRQRQLTAKMLLHGEEGRKTAKTQPERHLSATRPKLPRHNFGRSIAAQVASPQEQSWKRTTKKSLLWGRGNVGGIF